MGKGLREIASLSYLGTYTEKDSDYVRRLNELQMTYPFVRLLPDSADAYRVGVEQEAELATANWDRLQKGVVEVRERLFRLGQPVGGKNAASCTPGLPYRRGK
jgi:hypothetical protein